MLNKVAFIYHSETGNTETMTGLIADELRVEACEARVMAIATRINQLWPRETS